MDAQPVLATLGPLSEPIEEAVVANDVVCAAVLSGNRNFEARIHPNIRANFLASPPLVVAYAIAGSVRRDLTTEPLGFGEGGKPVWLSDVWPSEEEVQELMKFAANAETFRRLYSNLTKDHPLWNEVSTARRGGLRLAPIHLYCRAAVLPGFFYAASSTRWD